jgi:tetratricopeptide (TPR) repeat protein
MKLPTPPPRDVRDLIARCLLLYEERGPGAVDEVLADHPDSSEFVRKRLNLLERMGLVGEASEEAPPERIGDYRIVDELGRGGMGVVYEAEQERPRRRVALKVLRRWPGETGLGRFQHEAELLARLQHPGIAAIYEAGTAQIGGMTAPFFAMELVRGLTLDRFANENRLDARARLALLAEIADAVHHAHLKGVVHRDLKPANVLIDERGRPRVLDFGVARAIDPELQLETLQTEVGQLIGTLAYMSPEQASGDPDEIDGRSDVYSLGVIGYELLAGRLPIEVKERTALDTLQAVLEEEATPLGRLDRTLRGDVETIFAVALAKEKERRYTSAHELAADIRRHLTDEPITARPATATYQLGKFARRHRALVGGALGIVLALIIGLAGTLYGLVQASRERDDAERRFRQASAVLGFQGQMFKSSEGVQVEDLLDRSLLLLKGRASDDPIEDAAIRLMLGKACHSAGRYEMAEPLIAEAAATFERDLGPNDLQTLSARAELASLLGHPMGRPDEAEAALEGVVETAERVHGATHDVTLRARIVQAGLLFDRGRHEEAIAVAREVEQLAKPGDSHWIAAKNRIARSLNESGAGAEAIAIARELLERNRDTLGREHPSTWSSMASLGTILQRHGRVEEGMSIVRELLDLRLEFLGPAHPDTLDAQIAVGLAHYNLWQYDEGAALVQEAVEIIDTRFAPGHPIRLYALNTLGLLLMGQKRPLEAEPILREGFERTSDLKGPEHVDTLNAMVNLGQTQRALGRDDEAEAIYIEALAIGRRALGERHPDTLHTCLTLGKFYTRTKRYEEADALLREAVETGREVFNPDDEHFGAFLFCLGNNLLLQGRYPEAEEVLMECLDWRERTEHEGSPSTTVTLEVIETLYERWGKPDEAAIFSALVDERSRGD